MESKNFNWRPMSEYTGGRVLATNGLDVLIGEINSDGDCESEEDRSTVLCGITGFIKIEEMLPKSEDERIELLNYLYDVHDDDEERARWIAWLEKQGEQKKRLINKACDVLVDCIEDFMFRRMEVWSEECKKQTLENIRKTLEE